MKVSLRLGALAVVLMLTISAGAVPSAPDGGTDLVVYLGQTYCLQMDWCPDFAYWGTGTPTGYVELTEPDGTPSDYLWVDYQGNMTFESSPLTISPPAGLPLLRKLVDDGTLQEIDQFFPNGRSRPLFIQGETDAGMASQSSAPEPSSLYLLAPAAGLAYRRIRRLWRA